MKETADVCTPSRSKNTTRTQWEVEDGRKSIIGEKVSNETRHHKSARYPLGS